MLLQSAMFFFSICANNAINKLKSMFVYAKAHVANVWRFNWNWVEHETQWKNEHHVFQSQSCWFNIPLFVVADINCSSCWSLKDSRLNGVSVLAALALVLKAPCCSSSGFSCASRRSSVRPLQRRPRRLLQGVIDFGRGSGIELYFSSAPGECLHGLFWLRIRSGSFWFRFMGGESLPLPCLAEY